MSLWKRTTPITTSRLHPHLSRPSESATQSSLCPKWSVISRPRRKTATGTRHPTNYAPPFSPTIRERSRSRIRGLTFADTPQDERTPAARSAQRGFFHVRGRAGKLPHTASCGIFAALEQATQYIYLKLDGRGLWLLGVLKCE